MQAWAHTRRGSPPIVLSITQVPIPIISSPSQTIVKISHAAFNPGASIVMHLLPFWFRSSPAISEMDFSGTIVSCGISVPFSRNLEPGTKVFGSIPVGQHVKTTSGALAEYVVIEHTAVVKAPEAVGMEELAGLGIAGATALELVKRSKLKKGDSVLVNGASGGVGHLVVQICRDMVGETGRVVAVCSSENVKWVSKLGVDEVVDYTAHMSVTTHLASTYGNSRLSAVIDAVGIQDFYNASPGFLADGKPYVSIGPKAKSYTYWGIFFTLITMMKNFLWPQILGGVPRAYVQITGIVSLEALERLKKMVGEGRLKVHVGMLVEFEDVHEAYEKMLSGHAQGKIVARI